MHFINDYFSKSTRDTSLGAMEKLLALTKDKKNHVFVDTIISPSYTSAIAQVIQIPGVSGMDNNMMLLEFDKKNPTRSAIRSSISRRFEVESVGVITYRDVTVTQVDGGFEVAAVYDHTSPFIGNISFTVHFDKTRVVRR